MTPADHRFEDFFPEFRKFSGRWLDGDLSPVISHVDVTDPRLLSPPR